jgi:hypothetical protein
MAKTIKVTILSRGTDLGPFTIYQNSDNYTTPLVTGVLGTTLDSGYVMSGVDDSTTSIRISSTEDCLTSRDVVISDTTISDSTGDLYYTLTATVTSTSTGNIVVSNITGGSGPYTVKVLGHSEITGVTVDTTFGNMPSGIHRVQIVDSLNDRSPFIILNVENSNHLYTNRINWDHLHNNQGYKFPNYIKLVYGFSAPIWSGEDPLGEGVDALKYGWSHVSNVEWKNEADISSDYVESFYVPAQTTYNDYNDSIDSNNIAGGDNLKVINCTLSSNYLSTSVADRIAAASRFYYSDAVLTLYRDGYSSSDNKPKFILWDDEDCLPWDNKKSYFNAALFEAFLTLSDKDGNENMELLLYGPIFSKAGILSYTHNSWANCSESASNWKEQLYPYLCPEERVLFYRGESNLTALNKSIPGQYIDSYQGYYKVPLPQTQTKYEKAGNAFVLDIDGDRKFRNEQFSETIRGEAVEWKINSEMGAGGGFQTAPEYGYSGTDYNNRHNLINEAYWGVVEKYQKVGLQTALLIACRHNAYGDEDIYNTTLTDLNVRPLPVVRDDTEGITFPAYKSTSRSISSYELELQSVSAILISGGYDLWSSIGNMDTASNGNQPFISGSGNWKGIFKTETSHNFSNFEAITQANNHLYRFHERYGILNESAKKLFFTEPANITNEIIGLGRIYGTSLFIFLSEPRMDFDENMTITVRNTLNSYSKTLTLEGCTNLMEVLKLPTGYTYKSKDIYIEYTDILGTNHTVTGDIRYHMYNPGLGTFTGFGGNSDGSPILTDGEPGESPSPTPTTTTSTSTTTTTAPIGLDCSKSLSWLDGVTISSTTYPSRSLEDNGDTRFFIGVEGGGSQNVELSLDDNDTNWTIASPSNERATWTVVVPSTGNLQYFAAKIVGCNVKITGYLYTNQPGLGTVTTSTSSTTTTLGGSVYNCGLLDSSEFNTAQPYTNGLENVSSSWWLGWVGYFYNSDYWAERDAYLNNGGSGYTIYDFKGQTGVTYPTKVDLRPNNGSGVDQSSSKQITSSGHTVWSMAFPGHSITSNNAAANAGTSSKVRMEFYEYTNNIVGNLVWLLCDTLGGIHTAYDPGLVLRGNNHPDATKRWIKEGRYLVRVWNLNPDPVNQPIRFEFLNQNQPIIDDSITDNNEHTYVANCVPLNTNEWLGFKLNCNWY